MSYRKEIINDDGSLDVYEADSLAELVDKLADAKRAAAAQTRKVCEEMSQLLAAKRVDEQDRADWLALQSGAPSGRLVADVSGPLFGGVRQ